MIGSIYRTVLPVSVSFLHVIYLYILKKITSYLHEHSCRISRCLRGCENIDWSINNEVTGNRHEAEFIWTE